MIIHRNITKCKADELGYLDNYLTAVKEGIDITEYHSGSIISYWVITECGGAQFSQSERIPFVKIMIMKVDEATEYVRKVVHGE